MEEQCAKFGKSYSSRRDWIVAARIRYERLAPMIRTSKVENSVGPSYNKYQELASLKALLFVSSIKESLLAATRLK